MSEHLPECFSNKLSGDSRHCICEELRACEQRILSLNPIAIGVLIAQRSRERALDAAREEVDSMVIETAGNSAATVEQALAAIDALREKL